MVKTSESRRQANARWDSKNAKSYGFKCFRKTDTDLINLLDNISNRNAYIKALLRADLDKLQAAPGEAVCEKFINRNAPGPDPAGPEKSEMD